MLHHAHSTTDVSLSCCQLIWELSVWYVVLSKMCYVGICVRWLLQVVKLSRPVKWSRGKIPAQQQMNFDILDVSTTTPWTFRFVLSGRVNTRCLNIHNVQKYLSAKRPRLVLECMGVTNWCIGLLHATQLLTLTTTLTLLTLTDPQSLTLNLNLSLVCP